LNLASFSTDIKTRFVGAAPITPRMILTHHSGLPRDYAKGLFTRDPEPFTNLVHLIKDEYAAYPPDYVFSYSNAGLTLLGHAVEQVSGRPFATYMDERILRPLGMNHSPFSPGPAASPAMSKAYRNGKETDDFALRDVPAGGLNATVLDLGRFVSAIFAGGRAGDRRILRPETVAEMLRPQNTAVALDLTFRVGLGWMLSGLGDINFQNAGPVAHHAGATVAFSSQLIALPEHKLGVVVLANSFSATPAVSKIATDTLGLALEAKAGIKQPERRPSGTNDASLPPETAKGFVGHYSTLAGLANIYDRGGGLRADILGQTSCPAATGSSG